MADEIFVVNVGGYIGESTRREIAYAEKTEKKTTIWRNKMSKRDYIQANKDWLEAKAKALDDAEYYENLRAKREEQAAYDDFIASLDMND